MASCGGNLSDFGGVDIGRLCKSVVEIQDCLILHADDIEDNG